MSYSRITGLALLVSLLGAAEGEAKEKKDPSRVDLKPQFMNLPRTEQVDLCTEIRDVQKRKGKIFGTNPQCDEKYKTDTTYALCLDGEDIQGLRDSGLTVTEHPWTEYAANPAEACSGRKVCTEVTAPAAKEAQPSYQCQDGSWREHKAACPAVESLEQGEPVLTYVCPDDTPDNSDDNVLVDDSSKCPEVKASEPKIKYRCEDGTLVDVSYDCPHPHAATILVRIETAQGYSGTDGRTGTLAGAVDVEVGAGVYVGGFGEVRGDNWFWREASSSKKRNEDSQYIATESGDNLIGSQSDLETLTERGIRASLGPELLYSLYEGIASANAQARLGLTRQTVDSRTLETTTYWAQTQAGTVFQEGIPGPTGPAETVSSSETRYGLEPSVGINVWLPAKGPLAVGVGINASYHHPFGKSYSNNNWDGDGTINLIYLFGGDERK